MKYSQQIRKDELSRQVHLCAVCSFSVGGRGWGDSAGLCRALVAWRGGLISTEGEIGVLSVPSLFFDAGGSACRCMCVYTHTHTHTAHGVLGCEPGGQDETSGGPEESRWTKSRHMCIRICVQSTHLYIYAGRRDEILD